MATDLAIVLPDRPGALQDTWKKLDEAGCNIEGACAFPQRGATWGLLHILVEDGAAARRAVESAGFQVVAEREVLVEPIDERHGALADIFERFATDGTNVDLMYLASNHRVVIGTEDSHEDRPGYTTLGEKR